MKALELDFNRKPSTIPWLGLLLTTLGIVAVLWVMTQKDVATEHKAQLEQQEDDVALRIKQREAKMAAERNASPVSGKVEKIRRDQMLSNEPALTLLETVWEKEIAFTRIEIATVERNVKIDLEAKTLNDVLLLVDRLQADPLVKQVTLARNSVKIGDPLRPAVAALEINWHGPASAVASAATVPALTSASAPQSRGASR